MLEFNLFLMDYWYFSVPLFLSIVLWFRSETRRGGNRVDCDQLTNLVNKKSALLLDVRPKSEFDVPPPGGESLKDTSERVLPFFNSSILPKIIEGKNILVAAHGNSLRSLVMQLDDLSKEEVIALEIPTGAPIIYSFEGNEGPTFKENLFE